MYAVIWYHFESYAFIQPANVYNINKNKIHIIGTHDWNGHIIFMEIYNNIDREYIVNFCIFKHYIINQKLHIPRNIQIYTRLGCVYIQTIHMLYVRLDYMCSFTL